MPIWRPGMTRLILRSFYSLGDIVLLTAAVRDLHRVYPGAFLTDVRTPFSELWENNPYVTPLDEYDAGTKILECDLSLIDRSHEVACHCLHGYLDFLNRYLGVSIKPTRFGGDLHLSRRERAVPSPAHRIAGQPLPYWIVSSGGKYDYTAKWWDVRRYQEVVDHFRGRIVFVQVGAAGHFHPGLKGVIDLRGRTAIRDLIRLVYHSQGVLCGVTGLMHLAAAVPVKRRDGDSRPCVVVAGGRESPHWEAYPTHQFIHTVGALPCCSSGGCWRSRTVPLGDGDERDRSDHLCLDVVGDLPRCMDLISSAEVIRRIDTYFKGGALRPLPRIKKTAADRAVARPVVADSPRDRGRLDFYSAPAAAEEFIRNIPRYPGVFRGRGVVICGGGPRLFTNAWVCIRMLRSSGCRLPIELWHLGSGELDERMRALVAPWGVECVDALGDGSDPPEDGWHGWALKAVAVVRSRFAEILSLDADNMPVRNPEFLFDSPEYRRTGAVFWPDFGRLAADRPAWKVFGVSYRDEPEFESGQFLVNKRRGWRGLVLAQWYNEHSQLFYRHVYGDKDTFHMAFRKLRLPYAMPQTPLKSLNGAMCQHDFDGGRLFQHRNGDKWTLFDTNRRIRGFQLEARCRGYLDELRSNWDGRIDRFKAVHSRIRGSPAPKSPGSQDRPDRPDERPVRMMAFVTRRATGGGASPGGCATGASLGASDWGDWPVHEVWDLKRFRPWADRLAHTVWRGLNIGLESGADYLLWLGQSMEVNRRLRSTLLAWPPLHRRRIGIASLMNPGFRELGWELESNTVLVDPGPALNSQAVLWSRAAAGFAVRNWFKFPPAMSAKISGLAEDLRGPVLCHHPSLVQSVGGDNAWEAGAIKARDYCAA